MLLLTACQEKGKLNNIEQSTKTSNSIVGTWYELIANDSTNRWSFSDDGSYEYVKEYRKDEKYNHRGSYVIEDNIVTMTSDDGGEYGKYRIKYTDYGIKLMYAEEAGRPIELYENKQQLLETSPNYYKTKTYYKTIADKDGYIIEDGVLIAYVGNAKKIRIPSEVKTVDAIWYGEKLKTVIFPGTMEKIDVTVIDGESNIDYVYIEEGVVEIEDHAFWDAYLLELHIPSSVTKIGKDIIGVEEGGISEETKIYVKRNSYAHQYFVKEGLEDQLIFEEPGNDLIAIIVAVIVVVLVIGVSVAIAIIVKKKRK